jgi:hypothetical protein
MLSPDQVRAELGTIRQRTSKPINVNFFCHAPPTIDAALGLKSVEQETSGILTKTRRQGLSTTSSRSMH